MYMYVSMDTYYISIPMYYTYNIYIYIYIFCDHDITQAMRQVFSFLASTEIYEILLTF